MVNTSRSRVFAVRTGSSSPAGLLSLLYCTVTTGRKHLLIFQSKALGPFWPGVDRFLQRKYCCIFIYLFFYYKYYEVWVHLSRVPQGTVSLQTVKMRWRNPEVYLVVNEGKEKRKTWAAVHVTVSAPSGSERHHLRAAENRFRRGVWAQQQWQHGETQVHVHPRLQEAGLHCECELKARTEMMTPLKTHIHTHTHTGLQTGIRQANINQPVLRGQVLIGHGCPSHQHQHIKVCVWTWRGMKMFSFFPSCHTEFILQLF